MSDSEVIMGVVGLLLIIAAIIKDFFWHKIKKKVITNLKRPKLNIKFKWR